MWIKLLKPVDEHKPGTYISVEDTLGRAYVAAGMAEDGGKGPEDALFQRAIGEFKTELAGAVSEIATAAKDARASAAGFRQVTPGESEADKRKGNSDMLRNLVLTASPDRDESADAHKRLVEVYGMKRAMVEGQGSAGGYLTQTVFETQVLEIAAEEVTYLKGATDWPMSGPDVEIPALDQYQAPAPGQSAMFAGISIYRKGETIQRVGSQAAVKKVKLQANDMTALTDLSRNLIMDSNPKADALIPRLFGGAIAWREDWECANGSGEGQFLGLFSPAALASNGGPVLSVTRGTAGHFTYADAVAMLKLTYAQGKKRLRFVMHPFIEADLLTLTDPGGRYIYIPNWPGAQTGPAGVNPEPRLLGVPVCFSEKAPAPGSPGDVCLYDPSAILIGRRGGLEIGLSEHFRFDQDEVTFRAKLRNDAKPWMRKPITLADGAGTNKVSAYVVLV